MMNVLARKLECFVQMADDDRQFLDDVIKSSQTVPANTYIINEGDEPSNVHLILRGFACRNKVTPDGVRQIVAYLVPGDFCDLHVAILRKMDHSITTLSECEMVDVPLRTVDAMISRPRIAHALLFATLVDEATLREWLVNLCARDATEKLAHLFCELLFRLRAVGLAPADSYRLPLTQQDLADTIGLSNVHLNRVLQGLRAEGLIEFEGKHLSIRDFKKLAELSNFNPNYLHLAEKQTSI